MGPAFVPWIRFLGTGIAPYAAQFEDGMAEWRCTPTAVLRSSGRSQPFSRDWQRSPRVWKQIFADQYSRRKGENDDLMTTPLAYWLIV